MVETLLGNRHAGLSHNDSSMRSLMQRRWPRRAFISVCIVPLCVHCPCPPLFLFLSHPSRHADISWLRPHGNAVAVMSCTLQQFKKNKIKNRRPHTQFSTGSSVSFFRNKWINYNLLALVLSVLCFSYKLVGHVAVEVVLKTIQLLLPQNISSCSQMYSHSTFSDCS